jgi:hypothetical protein
MFTPVEFYLLIVLLKCTLDLMIGCTNDTDGVEGEADRASPADWEYERFTIPDERQPYYLGLMDGLNVPVESSHAP